MQYKVDALVTLLRNFNSQVDDEDSISSENSPIDRFYPLSERTKATDSATTYVFTVSEQKWGQPQTSEVRLSVASEQYEFQRSTATANMVFNPKPRTATNGWADGWTRSTVSNVSVEDYRFKHVADATDRAAEARMGERVKVDTTKVTTFSAYAEITAWAKGNFYATVYWYDAAGNYIVSQDIGQMTGVTARTRLSATYGAGYTAYPANAAYAVLRTMWWNMTSDNAGTAYSDSYEIEYASAPSAWVDNLPTGLDWWSVPGTLQLQAGITSMVTSTPTFDINSAPGDTGTVSSIIDGTGADGTDYKVIASRSSADGAIWGSWTPTNADGTLASPLNRYWQLQIQLTGTAIAAPAVSIVGVSWDKPIQAVIEPNWRWGYGGKWN